jgi:tRNA-dihydrouridine synthase B
LFLDIFMQIGSLKFNTDIIQAPLAGISCAPFRVLAHELGRPAYCVSEMVSAFELTQSYRRNNPDFKRYTFKDPKEGPLCMQLSGKDPKVLSQASKIAVDLGADIIDLNCGCPKKKIRKKGCGSKLMEDLDNLALCVNAIRSSVPTSIPVTIKIRKLNNNLDLNNLDANIKIAKTIEQAGADALILHGRSYQDDYDVLVDYGLIKNIVASVDIPVIGNGDVKDVSSLNKMRATGCGGVMVGRAGIGNPWIYNSLKDISYLSSINFDEDLLEDVITWHYEGLKDLVGEFNAKNQMIRIKAHYYKNFVGCLV